MYEEKLFSAYSVCLCVVRRNISVWLSSPFVLQIVKSQVPLIVTRVYKCVVELEFCLVCEFLFVNQVKQVSLHVLMLSAKFQSL